MLYLWYHCAFILRVKRDVIKKTIQSITVNLSSIPFLSEQKDNGEILVLQINKIMFDQIG